MMIGGLIGGMLGDRYGRRTALLGSVLAFAVLTLAIAFVNSIEMLGDAALPRRHRPRRRHAQRRDARLRIRSASSASVRGDADHRLHSARRRHCRRARWPRVIPAYGWRVLFIVGGVIPIVLALVLWKVLPESPRYLAKPPRALARADSGRCVGWATTCRPTRLHRRLPRQLAPRQ